MSCRRKRRSGLVVLSVVMLVSGLIVIPCTNEASEQDMKELAVSFLEDVAGIDMSSYSVGYFHVNRDATTGYRFPYTSVTFEFGDYKGRILLAQGRVLSYRLYDYSDTDVDFEKLLSNVEIEEPTVMGYADRLDTAFEKYEQHFSVDKSELYETLSLAKSTGEKEIESDSWRLNVNTEHSHRQTDTFVQFSWSEYVGEFKSTRGVRIVMTDSGVIVQLVSRLIYQYGTTDINISKEEAIEIARPYAEEFADEYGSEITGINATLYFMRDWHTLHPDNDNNTMLLYPKWTVRFEFYGDIKPVTGLYASIWADNGEVYNTGKSGTYGSHPPSPVPRSMPWNIIIPILIVSVVTFAVAYHKVISKGGRKP